MATTVNVHLFFSFSVFKAPKIDSQQTIRTPTLAILIYYCIFSLTKLLLLRDANTCLCDVRCNCTFRRGKLPLHQRVLTLNSVGEVFYCHQHSYNNLVRYYKNYHKSKYYCYFWLLVPFAQTNILLQCNLFVRCKRLLTNHFRNNCSR